MEWICLAVTLREQFSFRESQERVLWPVWCVSSPAPITLWIPHCKPQTNKIKRYYCTKQKTIQKGKESFVVLHFSFLISADLQLQRMSQRAASNTDRYHAWQQRSFISGTTYSPHNFFQDNVAQLHLYVWCSSAIRDRCSEQWLFWTSGPVY